MSHVHIYNYTSTNDHTHSCYISIPQGMIGTRDHTLSVIDWEESSSIGLLHGHHGNITSLDVIGQDSMVTSDDRGTIVLWDIKGVSPQSVIEYTGMREV